MSERDNRPTKVFRAGCIRASVWANDRQVNGRTVIRHSVRVDKRYFDEKTQEWKPSDYYFVDELPRLRLVVDRAFEFIALRESNDALREEPRA